MNIKSVFYKLNKDEFNEYLNNIKSSPNTIFLMDKKYFCYPDEEIWMNIIRINTLLLEANWIYNSFTKFSQHQIIQSFLIEEIENTLKIENICSTKHDIFLLLENYKTSKDKKIISICSTYKKLLVDGPKAINDLQDIRNIYDELFLDNIDPSSEPDGKYFRAKEVFITDGLNNIHRGIDGEDNINRYMKEFIDLYNSDHQPILKHILAHFIFETIHPYYDGNGRLGRYLFSNGLIQNQENILAFTLSSCLHNEKNKYYKSFDVRDDFHEHGCINKYVLLITEILINQFEKTITNLKKKQITIDNGIQSTTLSKNEKKILHMLQEATLITQFGISNNEILKETNVSKRTLMYTLKKFNEINILIDTKIGDITYHKLKGDCFK